VTMSNLSTIISLKNINTVVVSRCLVVLYPIQLVFTRPYVE